MKKSEFIEYCKDHMYFNESTWNYWCITPSGKRISREFLFMIEISDKDIKEYL